jgi:hypothetical protein
MRGWDQARRPGPGRAAVLLAAAGLAIAGCTSGSGGSGSGASGSGPVPVAAGGACAPAPAAAPGQAQGLIGLSAISTVSAVPGTRQAWAVGTRAGGSTTRRTTELIHIDGLSWSVAASFGPDSMVAGVAAVSRTAAWVWGQTAPLNDPDGVKEFVDLVSDGTVAAPPGLGWLTGVPGYVSDLAASGPDNAWLVGTVRHPDGRDARPAAARWDGRSWRRVPAPPGITGVAPLSTSGPAGTWAAVSDNAGPPVRLVRWTGSGWVTSLAPPAAHRGSVVATQASPELAVAAAGRQAWLAYTETVPAGESPVAGCDRAFAFVSADGTWHPLNSRPSA